MMYMNRGIPACITVVVVSSVAFFWLPVLFVFDLTHMIAGGLAGRVGGTVLRGTIAGAVRGIIVLTLWLVVYLALGLLTASALLWSLTIPLYTTVFGAVGGWTGRTV